MHSLALRINFQAALLVGNKTIIQEILRCFFIVNSITYFSFGVSSSPIGAWKDPSKVQK